MATFVVLIWIPYGWTPLLRGFSLGFYFFFFPSSKYPKTNVIIFYCVGAITMMGCGRGRRGGMGGQGGWDRE